jgi:PAS domain S-box-containing protein
MALTTNAQQIDVAGLLDAIPVAMKAMDRDTQRVIAANRCFLDLVGLELDDVLDAVPPYPWWAEGEPLTRAGKRLKRALKHRDGRVIPVEIDLHDLTDGTGASLARVEVVIDLSERQRIQKQLVQSGKLSAIGELAAGVAHEINNPLFAITGLVEFLLKDAEPGTKAYERLELVQQTALEIKEIVRALLDFARESSDDRCVVGLDAVVRETVELVERTSVHRGIKMDESLGVGPFFVHASPNQLKQVFLNLVANARQALPDGGRITIEVDSDDNDVWTSISDDGPGIPTELLGRIFEPFFTTKRETGGTGLGLAVSLGIAEAHGGTLTADSSPSGGACFTLRLPRSRR